MSRRTNQHYAQAVEPRRGGWRQGQGMDSVVNYYHPTHSQSSLASIPNHQLQPQQPSQPYYQNVSERGEPQRLEEHYESNREWTEVNPDVYKALNDPRLNMPPYCLGPSGQHQHHGGYRQSESRPSGQFIPSEQSNLSVANVYDFNYGREPSSKMATWEQESQREGPWYGNVEQEKTK